MFHNLSITYLILFIFNAIVYQIEVIGQDDLLQEYKYKDDTLEIILTSDKKEIQQAETFKLKIKIKNTSRNSILLFKRPNITFAYSKDSVENKLIINYGEHYVMDLIACDTMLILKPRKAIEFNYEFYCDSLLMKGIKGNTNILLGLGFISKLDKIYEFKTFNEKCPPNFINTTFLELSTFTIEATLSRKVFRTFFIRINVN